MLSFVLVLRRVSVVSAANTTKYMVSSDIVAANDVRIPISG